MESIGIDVRTGIRFRQHKENEKAHYAEDCWDCELLTSYGWIECVGIADRSAYDLTAHSKGIGKPLQASRTLAEPRKEDRIKLVLDKGSIAKQHKADSKHLFAYMEQLDNTQLTEFKNTVESGETYTFTAGGIEFSLTKDHVKKFQVKTVNVTKEKYTPSIIEPAFGFGRIVYALLEQSFHMRDEKRTFLQFKPFIAPVKCSILPLMSKPKIVALIQDIDKKLKRAGVSTRIDSTGQSIGKRYARTDEIGIPFGITIDFDTVEKELVTLRESLTMKQVQLPLSEVIAVVRDLTSELMTWEDVLAKYPEYESTE